MNYFNFNTIAWNIFIFVLYIIFCDFPYIVNSCIPKHIFYVFVFVNFVFCFLKSFFFCVFEDIFFLHLKVLFFILSFLGSTSGAVAAGMHVRTDISFYPNSLDDCLDYLTVETEGGEFKIPLVARRDAPQLNVPSTLDVGKYWR